MNDCIKQNNRRLATWAAQVLHVHRFILAYGSIRILLEINKGECIKQQRALSHSGGTSPACNTRFIFCIKCLLA